MFAELLLLGVGWKVFFNREAPEPSDDLPPTNVTPEDVETYRIIPIEPGVDKDFIWKLEIRMGALYSDGSGSLSWTDGGYIVGNEEGTGFTSASASIGGTQDFKLLVNGVETWFMDVLVYPDVASAREATTEAPDDPSGPQKQPDDDDSDDGGGSGGIPLPQPFPGFGGGVGAI